MRWSGRRRRRALLTRLQLLRGNRLPTIPLISSHAIDGFEGRLQDLTLTKVWGESAGGRWPQSTDLSLHLSRDPG